jgi:hypothetical protein
MSRTMTREQYAETKGGTREQHRREMKAKAALRAEQLARACDETTLVAIVCEEADHG